MPRRLGIPHTRGRVYVLSPDEHFEAKRALIDDVRMRTGTEGEPESEAPESSEKSGNDPTKSSSEEDSPTDRLFYLDELTYELHPTTGADWSPAGEQPTARRGSCRQRQGRLLAAMDAESGRLFYRQKPSVGREKLTDLYREMADAYQGVHLWVVQDNAPFHFHTNVLQALETQRWPRAHPVFEYARPPKWPDPTEAALSGGELQVQIVPLPTLCLVAGSDRAVVALAEAGGAASASLRWKQEEAKRGVRNFLERFAEDSDALLKYTGVSGD